MRTILTFLLGEELVSKKSDKDLKDAVVGLVMCWAMMILCWTAICIFG